MTAWEKVFTYIKKCVTMNLYSWISDAVTREYGKDDDSERKNILTPVRRKKRRYNLMKKRITSILLTLCMLASMLPAGVTALAGEDAAPAKSAANAQIVNIKDDAKAQAEIAESKDGKEQTEPDEVIAFAAAGEYIDSLKIYFDKSTGTITDADDNISGELDLSDGVDGTEVKQIGQSAFENCTALESIVLPETVANIGNYAFKGCTSLSSVEMPYNDRNAFTMKIGYQAFYGCSSLKELTLPETVTEIGREFIAGTGITEITIPQQVTSAGNALNGCTTLKTVTLAGDDKDKKLDGMKKIPDSLFENSSVSKVNIPETVTEIGRWAFQHCGNLTSINIPVQIEVIGEYAFNDCTSLASVTLNSSDKRQFDGTINRYAFSNTALTELEIPSTFHSLGDHLIENTQITSMTIHKTVTYSSGRVLAGCDSLTDVTLEEGMTWVPNGICEEVKNLTSITIPASVTEIGSSAFKNSGLTSIDIPKEVKIIGSEAFRNCDDLETVTLNYNDKNEFNGEIRNNAFSDCEQIEELVIPNSFTTLGSNFISGTYIDYIKIPKSITSASGALENCAKLGTVELEDGMTRIPNGLCRNTKITDIKIPESITEISDSTFYNCTELESITIPKTVKNIGRWAFQNCTSLTDVTIETYDNSRELEYSIGEYAFSGCANLTELIIPESFTSLGRYIIEKTAIESITIPKSIKQSGGNILANCDALTEVIFADGMTWVPNGICEGAPNLTEVIIPDSVTEIGDYAFQNCTSLTELKIPENVTRLGRQIIKGTAITTITIPKNVKIQSGGKVLAGCTSLTEVILEEGITCVPNGLCDYEDGNCYIENIVIPESVTEIGEYAFYHCNSFTEMNIPKNVAKIGYQAFKKCDKLAKVTFNNNEALDFALEIGNEAFMDCPNIKDLSLPDKVKSLGSKFISGTAISSITVPSTVTSANAAFDNAIWLDNVYFSEGMTKIPDGVCRNYNNNSYISNVEIPSTVTEIGYNAFENCIRLTKLTLPEGVTTIGSNAFKNCGTSKDVKGPLTVSCAEGMPTITNLIDNNINFSITKNITSYENLVFSDTHYVTDYSDVSTAGMVNLEVKYRFNPSVEDSIRDQKVIIRLPLTADVINETVKVNGVMSTDFRNDNNLLTIPVSEMSGTVSLCVEPTEQTRILSYAQMSYRLDNQNRNDVIGVINQDIPILTIKADGVTPTEKVTVSGIALPGEEVEFYCDGKKLGDSATAKLSGKYSAEITLPSTENYKTYTIEAVSVDNAGAEITAETNIMYREGAPQLTALNMYYNNVGYDLFNAGNIKPTILFEPWFPFFFEIKFDNIENIDQVYVVSNRNNSIKRMKAEYDPTSGTYFATGYFDESNRNYVPGVITVEYLQENEPYLFRTPIDFSLPKYVNTLPEEWEGCEITKGESAPAAEGLSGVAELINTVQGELDFSILSEALPEGLTEENAASRGYIKVTDVKGDVLYVKVIEVGDSKIQVEVADFVEKKLYRFLIENNEIVESESESDRTNRLTSIISVLGDITKIITFDGNRVDLEAMRQAVMNMPISPEEMQERLKWLDKVKESNIAALAILSLSTVLAMPGDDVDVPSASSPIFAALLYLNTYYIDLTLDEWIAFASRQSTGANLTCRWKIDPSGYVYEAVTTNRLEGVTTTAYWIEPDDIPESGEADESKSKLWDAEEYEQANPLITDVNGVYAWDVPEGLWQVTYEKEGYETQKSEWLPVPPPQTNVNIGLVSKAVPTVESAVLTPDSLTVTFDKYMDPESVKDNITIGGNEYTLSYPTNETAPDGTVYARKFVCTFENALPAGANVNVSISGAESYAGVKMSNYSESLSAGEAPPKSYDITIENVSDNKDDKIVTADFKNNTNRYQTFEAICAAYDDAGVLLEIQTTLVVAPGEDSVKRTFSFTSDWASCKIFAWSDKNSMVPVAEAVKK